VGGRGFAGEPPVRDEVSVQDAGPAQVCHDEGRRRRREGEETKRKHRQIPMAEDRGKAVFQPAAPRHQRYR